MSFQFFYRFYTDYLCFGKLVHSVLFAGSIWGRIKPVYTAFAGGGGLEFIGRYHSS